MSTSILRVFALAFSVMFAIACGAPPAPTVVASGPPPPLLAVAAGSAEPHDEDSDGPFVEDADPGPVPIRATDPWWGQRDAPVTIVAFGDFQCPFCTRAATRLSELRGMYGPAKLRVVWKHHPLPFHPEAVPAAIVSTMMFERFGNRGFWEQYDRFFMDQRNLADQVDQAASRLGISRTDLAQMINGNEGQRLKAAVEEANKLGVTGTPAFLINGVFLSGAQPVEKFTAVIDEQLAKAKVVVARGVPQKRVYAELSKAQWAPPKAPSVPADTNDEGTVYLVPIGKAAVRGNAAALVTIVEFAEVQCPFCARVVPTIEQVLAKYGPDVRFVWKHNPLPFHPRAKPAAILAMEARAQKGDAGFWRAHDLLFRKQCVGDPNAASKVDCEAGGGNNQWVDNQQHLTDQDLMTYARTLGLNAARVTAALAGTTYDAAIAADQDLADDVRATGTPHFFINGRRLVGAQPLERFVAVIDEELAKARAMVKSGVKPAQVYDRIMAGAKGPSSLETKKLPPPTRDNPSRGPANAKVVVQYFGDLQCPFCSRAHATIEELEKAFPGKIRVVWRNLPLAFHKNADPAAQAAMEAFRQKGSPAFWTMVEAMYANQSGAGLDRQALDGFAAQIGLDPLRFADAVDQRAHRAVIEADMKAAADAGITGTPAFVINDYFVSGAQPLSKFKKVVNRALAGK